MAEYQGSRAREDKGAIPSPQRCRQSKPARSAQTLWSQGASQCAGIWSDVSGGALECEAMPWLLTLGLARAAAQRSQP